VLLDGMTLPVAEELPQDIAGLCRCQYVVLRRRHTKVDLADLVERIIQAEPELATAAREHNLLDDDGSHGTAHRPRRRRAAVRYRPGGRVLP
jgi:hypothetical protein